MTTQQDFQAYVKVQRSGVTNMWDVRTVGMLSGLDKDTILDIMQNYGKYDDQWGDGKN